MFTNSTASYNLVFMYLILRESRIYFLRECLEFNKRQFRFLRV